MMQVKLLPPSCSTLQPCLHNPAFTFASSSMNPTDALKDLQQAELESAFALNQALFRSYEQLIQLQMQTLRLMVQQAAETAQSAADGAAEGREAQTLPGAQWMNAARSGGETVTSYFEKFGRIAAATQAEISQILQRSFDRVQTSLRDQPGLGAGAEPMQALLQSTMNWTTQALNALQDMQQQAARLMSAQTPAPEASASTTSASADTHRK